MSMVNPLRRHAPPRELDKARGGSSAAAVWNPPMTSSTPWASQLDPSFLSPDQEHRHAGTSLSPSSSPGHRTLSIGMGAGKQPKPPATARYSGRLRGSGGGGGGGGGGVGTSSGGSGGGGGGGAGNSSQTHDSDYIPYRGPISPPPFPATPSPNPSASPYASSSSHYAPAPHASTKAPASTTLPRMVSPVFGLGLLASRSTDDEIQGKGRRHLSGSLSPTTSTTAHSRAMSPSAAAVPSSANPLSTPNIGFGLPVAYDHGAHREQPSETKSFAHQSYLPALLRTGGSETFPSLPRPRTAPREYRPPAAHYPPPSASSFVAKSPRKQHSASHSVSSSDGDGASSAFGGRAGHSASTSMTSLRDPSYLHRTTSRDDASSRKASPQQLQRPLPQPQPPMVRKSHEEKKTPDALQLASSHWRDEKRKTRMADEDEERWAKALEVPPVEEQKGRLSPVPASAASRSREGGSSDSGNAGPPPQTMGNLPSHRRVVSEQHATAAAQKERELANRSFRLLQQLHLDELEAHHSDISGYLDAKDGCQRVLMPKPSLRHHQQSSLSHTSTSSYAFPKVQEPQDVSFERNRPHTKSVPDMRARVRAQQMLVADSLEIPQRRSSLRNRSQRPIFHHRMPPDPPTTKPSSPEHALGEQQQQQQQQQSKALRSIFKAPSPAAAMNARVTNLNDDDDDDDDDELDTPDLATVIAQGKAFEEEREQWRRQYQRRFESRRRNRPEFREGGAQQQHGHLSVKSAEKSGPLHRVRYAKSSPDLAIGAEKRTRFEEEPRRLLTPTSFAFLRPCGGDEIVDDGPTRSHEEEKKERAGCLSPHHEKPRPRARTIGAQMQGLSAATPSDQGRMDTMRTFVSDVPFVISRQGEEDQRRATATDFHGIGNDVGAGAGHYGVAYSSPRPILDPTLDPIPRSGSGLVGRQAIDRQSYLNNTPPQDHTSFFPALHGRSESMPKRGHYSVASKSSTATGSRPNSAGAMTSGPGSSLPVPPPRKVKSTTSSRFEGAPGGEQSYQKQQQQQQQRLEPHRPPFATPAFDTLEHFGSSSNTAFMTPPLHETTLNEPGYFAAPSNEPIPSARQSQSVAGRPSNDTDNYRDTVGRKSLSSDSSSFSRKSTSVRELWNADQDTEEQFQDLFLQRRRSVDAAAAALAADRRAPTATRPNQSKEPAPHLHEAPAERTPSMEQTGDSAFRARLASFAATVLDVDDDEEEDNSPIALSQQTQPSHNDKDAYTTPKPSRLFKRTSSGGESSILDPEVSLSVPAAPTAGSSTGIKKSADSAESSPPSSSSSRGKSGHQGVYLDPNQPTLDHRESASSLSENHYLLRPTNWPLPPAPSQSHSQQRQP